MSDVIDLAVRRQPTVYHLTVTHDWRGGIEVEVHDIPDDHRSKASIAAALRGFADTIDSRLSNEKDGDNG